MRKKVLLALALLASVPFALAQGQQKPPPPQGPAPQLPPPQQARVIEVCKGTVPPAGYVIVGEHFSPHCRESQAENTPRPNAWAMKKPGRQEVVCAESKYPENYAATGRVAAPACPGGSPTNNTFNALQIEQVD